MRTKKRIAICLVALLAAVPAVAQIFGGLVVHDPLNELKLIAQLKQMVSEYNQLVEEYQMIVAQYNHLKYMGRGLAHLGRYRSWIQPWLSPAATDTYGTTSGWMQAVNQGLNAASGYAGIVEKVGTYGPGAVIVPAPQRPRIWREYGGLELRDGANENALAVAGSLRHAAAGNSLALTRLQQDSMADDPDQNTWAALLNKVNAAAVMNAQAGQDANQVLVSLLEQQVLESTRLRNEVARAVNDDIAFRSNGPALAAAQAAGASQAMLNWRMP